MMVTVLLIYFTTSTFKVCAMSTETYSKHVHLAVSRLTSHTAAKVWHPRIPFCTA